jgi:hypothetical protein
MQALQEEPAEDFHDGLGIERWEGEKLSLAGEDSIRKQGMGMWVEVGAKGTEGLQRDYAARADIVAIEQGLESLKDGSVSGLRQKAKQLTIALEQATQGTGDGKGPMAVGDGSKDLTCELFGKEDGALRLATGAKIPGTA